MDGAGNIYVAVTEGPGNFLVYKRTGGGTTLWSAGYNGQGNGLDRVQAMALDGSGNAFVVGSVKNLQGTDDIQILKLNGSTGAVVWQASTRGTSTTGNNIAYAVAVDTAGNPILTGTSTETGGQNDIRTIKFNGASGAIVWNVTFNGAANSTDVGKAIALDASGNAFVAGVTIEGSINPNLRIIKYSSATGSVLWTQVIDGSAVSSDSANAIAVDASGNPVLTGFLSVNTQSADFVTMKFNGSTGAVLWTATFGDTHAGFDEGRAIAIDSGGNVVVTGKSVASGNQSGIRTIRYNGSTGAQIWNVVTYGSATLSAMGYAVTTDASNNVIVTGTTSESSGGTAARTIKYAASNGAVLWNQAVQGAGGLDDFGAAVTVDSSGTVYATISLLAGTGVEEVRTIAYDATTGAQIWNLTSPPGAGIASFNANRIHTKKSVVVDFAGNVIIGGQSNIAADRGVSMRIVKYNGSTGAEMWNAAWQSLLLPAGFAQIHSMAVDGDNNVVVTGNSIDDAGCCGYDIRTVKFAAATGAILWEASYNGTGSGTDFGNGLYVDVFGHVWVGGYSFESSGGTNHRIIKYDGQTGAVLYTTAYNGGGNGSDVLFAMAGDTNAPSGANFLVAGCSEDATNGRNLRINRYNPVTHANLNTSVYAGPLGDCAYDVTTDLDGHAIAAGYTEVAGQGKNILVAKFNASTGALIWSNTYAGSAALDDEAFSVTTDASRNVYIAGVSHEAGGTKTQRLIKLSGSTGSILWNVRTNASYSGYAGELRSVVIDDAGNVLVVGNTEDPSAGYYAGLVAKHRADTGAMIWTEDVTISGTPAASALSIAKMPANRFAIAGESLPFGKTQSMFAAKLKNTSVGTMSLASSLNPATTGASVTFTATLNTSEGSVDFLADGLDIAGCSQRPIVSQQATCTTSFATAGTRAITAVSTGSLNVDGATTTLSGGQVVNLGVYAINVLKNGTGAGLVTATAGASVVIDCGPDCAEIIAQGVTVVFNAVASPGSVFAGWSNCPSASGPVCTLLVSAARTVTATFNVSAGGAGAKKFDFNGDAKGDILWRNASTGQNYLYPMNGTSILATEGPIRSVAAPWVVAGVGDFDGDGKADILWRNSTTGENYIYPMNGTAILSTEGPIRTVSTAWAVTGIGDFDGDGKSDILWRHTSTGENYIYFMDGKTIKATEGFIRTVPTAWVAATIADFDGDGKADILWRNSTTGENYLYPMDGKSIKPTEGTIRSVPTNWIVAGSGDFDGDGKADILWRNSSTGENYLYPMDGKTIKATEGPIRTVSTAWIAASLADFDGDGKIDILWRNTSTGENYIYPMDGRAIKATEGYTRSVSTAWTVVSK